MAFAGKFHQDHAADISEKFTSLGTKTRQPRAIERVRDAVSFVASAKGLYGAALK